MTWINEDINNVHELENKTKQWSLIEGLNIALNINIPKFLKKILRYYNGFYKDFECIIFLVRIFSMFNKWHCSYFCLCLLQRQNFSKWLSFNRFLSEYEYRSFSCMCDFIFKVFLSHVLEFNLLILIFYGIFSLLVFNLCTDNIYPFNCTFQC